jgi:RimJ/RimL family protein N-acetyltransferase
MTSGDVYQQNQAYNPQEVWSFAPDGPFNKPEELRKSFVFQRRVNEAGFAIVENLTDKMIGVILLTNDNPRHLGISMELPILKPSSDGTAEQIEACFLLLDRLFALGYRRVQLSVDSMDTKAKKLSGRLGFTQEGLIPKDRVVKESNRDSVIYGMLNSDWDKGARSFLFKKLHGEKTLRADLENTTKEDTLDTQNKFIADEKEREAKAEKIKK